jgi:hypothetical protein
MIEPSLAVSFEGSETPAGSEKTCAQRLTEVLQTGNPAKVAVALLDIEQRVTGDVRRFFEFGYNMHLSEMLDILGRAGLQLVAVESTSADLSSDKTIRR